MTADPIRDELNISPYTAELNLHNPAELILYAVRKGIISCKLL